MTSEDDDFGGFENFAESLRLSKPVTPEGWLALFHHLGLPATKNTNFRDQFQDPFFYSSDASHSVPVYICGPLKTPYDDEDPAANQLKKTFEQAISGKYDTAFMFYSAPVSCGEMDGANVTYWGEVYVDSKWRTMVLNKNSTSIGAIISQAQQTNSVEADLTNATLTDSSEELIKVWSENHVDPMLEMFASKL